jgi:hypothetical protein
MRAHTEKLLSVEDVFSIPGRGLIITPKIAVTDYRGPKGKAFFLLRKPDGSESRVLAEFTMPFVSPPPKDLFLVCSLAGLQKEDVPLGSEIHRFIESETNA